MTLGGEKFCFNIAGINIIAKFYQDVSDNT
jgi:hypothetical protein